MHPDRLDDERRIVHPLPGRVAVPARLCNRGKAAPVRPDRAPYLVVLIRDQHFVGSLHELDRSEVVKVHSWEPNWIAHFKRVIYLRECIGSPAVAVLVGLPSLFPCRRERHLTVLPVYLIVISSARLNSVPPSCGRLPGSKYVMTGSGTGCFACFRAGYQSAPTIDMLISGVSGSRVRRWSGLSAPDNGGDHEHKKCHGWCSKAQALSHPCDPFAAATLNRQVAALEPLKGPIAPKFI